MTTKIKLSRLAALGLTEHDFGLRVARIVDETKAWREHMVAVAAGTAQKYPAPSDILDVMSSVSISDDGSVSADYVIEDDTPKPADLVPAKKAELVNSILALESKINGCIEPPLRMRKNARLIRSAEMTRSPKEQAIADAITAKGVNASPDEKDALDRIKAKQRRLPRDESILAARDQRAAMRDQLDEWVADKLAEIDDLTVENIDNWSPGDPPIQVE
jgi:hypothetical protein